MQDNKARMVAAEKAYQDFQFASSYWPASAGDWSVTGSNFTRPISIVYDAEEDIYGEGEFGVSFADGQETPDQLWATLGRRDISRDGVSVNKCDRRGYEAPTDLFDYRADVAEQAYVDFEFADGLLPCGEDEWRDVGSGCLARHIFVSGGEEEDDRVAEFRVCFDAGSVSITRVSATLAGRDMAYRPRRGGSLSRPR